MQTLINLLGGSQPGHPRNVSVATGSGSGTNGRSTSAQPKQPPLKPNFPTSASIYSKSPKKKPTFWLRHLKLPVWFPQPVPTQNSLHNNGKAVGKSKNWYPGGSIREKYGGSQIETLTTSNDDNTPAGLNSIVPRHYKYEYIFFRYCKKS
ncbi:unnamed protein product [Allacma fusca]|uniref:Uncharacterized protein n=1 Tax=Allacma fusca TaxID=39272 RepID=A0A8J2JWZ7_9HEXA|nr:unnamed protein product [Allacma fusca]